MIHRAYRRFAGSLRVPGALALLVLASCASADEAYDASADAVTGADESARKAAQALAPLLVEAKTSFDPGAPRPAPAPSSLLRRIGAEVATMKCAKTTLHIHPLNRSADPFDDSKTATYLALSDRGVLLQHEGGGVAWSLKPGVVGSQLLEGCSPSSRGSGGASRPTSLTPQSATSAVFEVAVNGFMKALGAALKGAEAGAAVVKETAEVALKEGAKVEGASLADATAGMKDAVLAGVAPAAKKVDVIAIGTKIVGEGSSAAKQVAAKLAEQRGLIPGSVYVGRAAYQALKDAPRRTFFLLRSTPESAPATPQALAPFFDAWAKTAGTEARTFVSQETAVLKDLATKVPGSRRMAATSPEDLTAAEVAQLQADDAIVLNGDFTSVNDTLALVADELVVPGLAFREGIVAAEDLPRLAQIVNALLAGKPVTVGIPRGYASPFEAFLLRGDPSSFGGLGRELTGSAHPTAEQSAQARDLVSRLLRVIDQ